MPDFSNLDDEARAELLSYLVVAQLVGHSRTGEWLRTDHLVESTRIWLASNGGACDWLERIDLADASIDLAPDFLTLPGFAESTELAGLFTDGWRLDYRSRIVRNIHDRCAAHLPRIKRN
jgi:hypothetical protein